MSPERPRLESGLRNDVGGTRAHDFAIGSLTFMPRLSGRRERFPRKRTWTTCKFGADLFTYSGRRSVIHLWLRKDLVTLSFTISKAVDGQTAVIFPESRLPVAIPLKIVLPSTWSTRSRTVRYTVLACFSLPTPLAKDWFVCCPQLWQWRGRMRWRCSLLGLLEAQVIYHRRTLQRNALGSGFRTLLANRMGRRSQWRLARAWREEYNRTKHVECIFRRAYENWFYAFAV